jgi:glycyl-tRNA synthetase
VTHVLRESEWKYADCWDCEVHTTYGWIECAGLADRSAFDLTAHGKASKVDLVAYENFDEPKTMEVVEVVPNMKILGKELKQAGKLVADHLTSLPEEAAMALKVLISRFQS